MKRDEIENKTEKTRREVTENNKLKKLNEGDGDRK